jgi:hypothetical protein
MKPSSELFMLIKSLTKSEKRFFKLSSTLQTGDKNYVKLFDAIESQSVYDEEEIKRKYKNEIFIKHLPSEKNHLYKIILKSLRSFHADNSVRSILQEELKNVEILFKKALYKECGKIINRSKKLAYENERFYYLFEFINWEKILLEEEYQAGKFDRDLNELIIEEKNVLEKLQNLAEYRILYSKINFVFRKGGYARNDQEKQIVEDILNHPLIKGKNTALSRSAAATCYYIQGLCALVKYEYEKSFEKFSHVVRIFEDNPRLIIEIPKQYIRSLNNLLLCYLDKEDYNSFFELLKKIRLLKNQPGFNSEDIALKIFTSTFLAELNAYNKIGDYQKATSIAEEIKEGIENYKNKISKEEEILFYFNIAYAYFGDENYKEALKWINIVINDNEQELRQDIFSFARLFSLIIHFELENYDLLEYMLKSAGRYYQKRKNEKGRAYEFENMFIKNMKKILKETLKGSKLDQNLKLFKEEMETTLEDKYEKIVLDYFDFVSWINAKIEKTTLSKYKLNNQIKVSK